MRNAIITVCVNAEHYVTLLYKGRPLPYTVFHKQAKQAEVVLAKISTKQSRRNLRPFHVNLPLTTSGASSRFQKK
jgi:hypothetical protein